MTDNLQFLMTEIGKHAKIVSSDEADELYRRNAEGDADAGEKLFWSVAKLAVRECRRYSRNRDHFTELLSPAFEGALRGIHGSRYDASLGVKFSSYVIFLIRERLLKHISQSTTVHIAQARYWKMTREDSLPTQESLEGCEVEDGFSGFDDVDREDEVACELEKLDRAMRVVNKREKAIVEDYYMRGKTLLEIGSEIGVTRERVRQIRDRTMRMIRGELKRGGK